MAYIVIENDFQLVYENQTVDSSCNCIFFKNQTDTGTGANVFINNTVLLKPGESIAFNNEVGVVDKTRYSIRFSGAGQKQVLVSRRYERDAYKSVMGR